MAKVRFSGHGNSWEVDVPVGTSLLEAARYTVAVQSKAKTVKEYLASLPEDRRKAISAVRAVIRKNLDKTYEEGMQYGAIGYYVPHRVYPHGYHCDPKQPLPFAGLGWQKKGPPIAILRDWGPHHMSLGIMSTYMDGAEGKRLRDE